MAEINEGMKPFPSSAYQPSDPAKVACPPDYEAHEDYLEVNFGSFMPGGPGGKSTNIENNEKGILETGMMNLIAKHRQASLGSNHDMYRMGVYGTNSMGDND